MTDTTTLTDISSHSGVKSYIDVIAVGFALEVAIEDPAVTDHAARATFAQRVLQGLVPLNRFALVVLSEPSLKAGVLASPNDPVAALVEGAIYSRIVFLWNYLAKIGF